MSEVNSISISDLGQTKPDSGPPISQRSFPGFRRKILSNSVAIKWYLNNN